VVFSYPSLFYRSSSSSRVIVGSAREVDLGRKSHKKKKKKKKNSMLLSRLWLLR